MQARRHSQAGPQALFILTTLAAAALAACGGDGDSQGGSGTPTTLTGVVAVGAPMANATLTVVDSDANTANPAAITTAADGSYSVVVTGLVAPLFVRASGTVNGEPRELTAVVPTLTPETSNRANVTPLTSAVATLVAPAGNVTALNTPAELATSATAARVGNASALLVNTLNSDPGTAALLGNGFNPLTVSFSANGTGVDEALQRIEITLDGGSVRVANLAAVTGDKGTPAAVTLTPALAATPNNAPTLAPSAPAGSLPTPAELAALGAKWQACLALPIAQRVTTDANGNVTGVLGACNFTPANWRSNGRSFAQEVGQSTLTKGLLTGSRVGAATIVTVLPAAALTDPKEFKHPNCNDAPCVQVRFPLVTANGRPTSSDWLLGKVNGNWEFVGNQRPYRTIVETRLTRKINMNRAGAAANSTVDPYFLSDRYESLLRLTFDPSVGDTSDVRAVRFTGPGLPAAGVVQVRSQRCGTDDRMAIINQVGSTRVIGGAQSGVQQFWTGGSATEFIVDAARLDGSALQRPVPVNTATIASFQDHAPAGLGDLRAVAPANSRYKVEVFRFSSNSDTPDEVFYVRNAAGLENASAGPSVVWPTLDPAYATARLTPGGSQAGEKSTFAETIAWTLDPAHYVTSSFLFGQDFATVTNAQNETASFALRGRIDHEPAVLGDTTATGWRMASPRAGTALSPATATIGTNPNPRCAAPLLPALTANPSDYREVGLLTRGPDRQVRQASWFWEN